MTENAPRVVESAGELLRDVTIKIDGVNWFKVNAELDEEQHGDSLDFESISPSYALRLRAEGSEIGTRLDVHLSTNIGRLDVDVAINYAAPYPVALTQEAQLEFANEVAIMALIPYVRECIASLSARVFGETILMPILQRGELHFSEENNVDSKQ